MERPQLRSLRLLLLLKVAQLPPWPQPLSGVRLPREDNDWEERRGPVATEEAARLPMVDQ